MQQVGWLTRGSSGEESLLFSWQTRKADMPHRPCQDILKPLQSACTITDIHINYNKTLRDTHAKAWLMFQTSDNEVVVFRTSVAGIFTSFGSRWKCAIYPYSDEGWAHYHQRLVHHRYWDILVAFMCHIYLKLFTFCLSFTLKHSDGSPELTMRSNSGFLLHNIWTIHPMSRVQYLQYTYNWNSKKKESTYTNTFSSLLFEELYINMSSQEWEAEMVFILCGSTH